MLASFPVNCEVIKYQACMKLDLALKFIRRMFLGKSTTQNQMDISVFLPEEGRKILNTNYVSYQCGKQLNALEQNLYHAS